MKLTFNKVSVILMYICIIGFFPFCLVTSTYPPAEWTICWYVFWIGQSFITSRLTVDKRTHKANEKKRIQFLEAVTPYLNEENASALVEKYIGIEPKYNKKKKGDK